MWSEHVVNPQPIRSIFPTQEPSLCQVELQDLTLICGGDLQCRLQFDLPEFPDPAPAKWVQRKYNTVQLTLTLLQVTVERCVIPSGNGRGDLRIEPQDGRLHVTFRTPAQGVVFRAVASWIHVDSISAFQQEKDEGE